MDALTDAVLQMTEGAPIEVGLAAAAAPAKGAVGIMVHRINRRFELMHCGTSGVADELVRVVEDRFMTPDNNPIVARLPHAPRERLTHASTFADWNAYLRSDLYASYCRPADCHNTGILLCGHREAMHMGALGMRHGADWPEQAVIEEVEANMRAVCRAYEAGLSREACERTAWSGRVRGLILDARLRFWRLTDDEAAALVRLGLLGRACEAEATPALREGRLGDALGRARAGQTVRVVAAAPSGEAYQLGLAPGPALRGEATVVLETEALTPAAWDALSLAEVYGLTPREAAVALHLMHGGTTQSAADALALTRETVRTYLRAMFSKTDVGTQSQLVALLNGASSLRG